MILPKRVKNLTPSTVKKNNKDLPPQQGLALWIIPNPEVLSILQSEIDRLAELHQAIPFPPHITAARLPVRTPDEIVKMIDEVSQRIHSHSISIGEIRLSSNPYQNMVIDLEDSPFSGN